MEAQGNKPEALAATATLPLPPEPSTSAKVTPETQSEQEYFAPELKEKTKEMETTQIVATEANLETPKNVEEVENNRDTTTVEPQDDGTEVETNPESNVTETNEKKDTAEQAMEGEMKISEKTENAEGEMDYIIVGRSIKTRVLDRINFGSYGDIHNGIFLNTGEKVAVKLEPLRSTHPQLLAEGNAMRKLENGPGMPKIYWFGSFEPRYNVMVMTLLGPNLQHLLAYCGHKFSLKTVLLVADQMLDSMEWVHHKEYVHRDIKPDNFAIGPLGTELENRIFLFDFGLARKYQRQRYSVPTISSTFGVTHPLAGTVRYMGLHAHDGQSDQPRDDLESLAYVFVYFLKGHLPWQGIRGCKNKEEKLINIRKMKASLTPEQLCSDLPMQFASMIDKCRRARNFDSDTCAKNWRKVFRALAQELEIGYDHRFDWVVKREGSGEEIVTDLLKNRGHDSS